MIDLNVTALMRLTYAAAPAFVARGGGTIINISLGGRHRAGTPERRLWRNQSLRARLEPVASQGTGRQERAHPGRPARRDRDQLLGRSRRRGREPAEQDRHAGRTIWSTRRSPASIRANSSPSPRFPTQRTGTPTKRRGRSSCRIFPSAQCRRVTEPRLRRNSFPTVRIHSTEATMSLFNIPAQHRSSRRSPLPAGVITRSMCALPRKVSIMSIRNRLTAAVLTVAIAAPIADFFWSKSMPQGTTIIASVGIGPCNRRPIAV